MNGVERLAVEMASQEPGLATLEEVFSLLEPLLSGPAAPVVLRVWLAVLGAVEDGLGAGPGCQPDHCPAPRILAALLPLTDPAQPDHSAALQAVSAFLRVTAICNAVKIPVKTGKQILYFLVAELLYKS